MHPKSLVYTLKLSFNYFTVVLHYGSLLNFLFIDHATFDFEVQYLISQTFNSKRIFLISLLYVQGLKATMRSTHRTKELSIHKTLLSQILIH